MPDEILPTIGIHNIILLTVDIEHNFGNKIKMQSHQTNSNSVMYVAAHVGCIHIVI